MNDTQNATDVMALRKFVGQSEWTKSVRDRIRQVANHKYNVLVTGPSGTGKELIARAVHECSDRRSEPFVPVNCAAIPPSLFTSQLFGHVKGAFTGAQYASLGCFRAAQQGTIFLDEIGELDLDCQAKLLRVLQERVVTPVGGTEEIPIEVRTVAATNRDLAEEVRAGRFRLDLYYRLNVISIESKGLTDRREDILPLADHFLAKTAIECGQEVKHLSDSAIALLESYSWPGNVRELENFIERAVVLSDGPWIGPEAFEAIYSGANERLFTLGPGEEPPGVERYVPMRPRVVAAAPVPAVVAEPEPTTDESVDWPTLAKIEEQHVRDTVRAAFFNQSAAARMLGIDRKSLARKIKKYGIVLPRVASTSRSAK